MKWHYVENGAQAGPVEETELGQLIQSGKLNGSTLVWHEGMAAWQPFSAVCPAAYAPLIGAAPAMPAAEPITSTDAACAECGKVFNKNDMIPHGNSFICAQCKPVFMQKLAEGVAGTGTPLQAGSATVEDVLARDYQHDIGNYLSRGWEIFKRDAGILIGATVLVYLCLIVVNVIPYASTVLSIIFTGPLLGGLWLLYLKRVRQQEATVGDAFGGFGPRFGQLLLGNFIPGLLSALCMIPVIVLAVIAAIVLGGARSGGSHANAGIFITLGVLLGIIGLCGWIYLMVCWFFTLPLIADKKMNFGAAMTLSRKVVIKHWWSNLGLSIVVGLVAMSGILACGVGVIVTGPIAFVALCCAYEKLFGDLAPAQL